MRVPSLLGQQSLPLRIEMENYEDAEAVAAGETRQKRSVSAKAARYAMNDPNAQQVEEAQTPSVAGSAVSVAPQFHPGAQLPVSVVDRAHGGANIMDDWGAFTSQAAVMTRPPPQMMTPQGMPPQGMPPQGMPPQGMPPQAMPLQGIPPPQMHQQPPSMGQPPPGMMMPPPMGGHPGRPGMYGVAQEMNAQGPPSGMMDMRAQPPPGMGGSAAPSPDQFGQLMGIPEFRDFLHAGDRIGLAVMDIFRVSDALLFVCSSGYTQLLLSESGITARSR